MEAIEAAGGLVEGEKAVEAGAAYMAKEGLLEAYCENLKVYLAELEQRLSQAHADDTEVNLALNLDIQESGNVPKCPRMSQVEPYHMNEMRSWRGMRNTSSDSSWSLKWTWNHHHPPY